MCNACQALMLRATGLRPSLPRPALLFEDMAPESRFQAAVIRAAEAQDWRFFHAHKNKRNVPGFPDLCLAKAGEQLMIEVKTNTGVVEPEQEAWLAVLNNPPWVIAEIWRPARWSLVLQRLGYPGVS